MLIENSQFEPKPPNFVATRPEPRVSPITQKFGEVAHKAGVAVARPSNSFHGEVSVEFVLPSQQAVGGVKTSREATPATIVGKTNDQKTQTVGEFKDPTDQFVCSQLAS